MIKSTKRVQKEWREGQRPPAFFLIGKCIYKFTGLDCNDEVGIILVYGDRIKILDGGCEEDNRPGEQMEIADVVRWYPTEQDIIKKHLVDLL